MNANNLAQTLRRMRSVLMHKIHSVSVPSSMNTFSFHIMSEKMERTPYYIIIF